MTVASIDIGSNTVLLLIAKINLELPSINTLQNFYKVPRISQGLRPWTQISKNKIGLLYEILIEYNNVIKDYECSHVFAVGTNAFRIASNGSEIINEIQNIYKWNIKIITGDEEARLSFLGAAFPFESEIENKTVIDIGGGSTEIIFGNKNNIIYKKSFPVGVVSLTEKYFKMNPPSVEELEQATEDVDIIFKELNNTIPSYVQTIAVAGTPTTLCCIKQGIREYDDSLVDNSILRIDEINSIFKKISMMDKNEISYQYGQVVEGREDVLTAGTLLLLSLMKILKLDSIVVSGKGLRYGVVYDFMQKMKSMKT